MRAMFEKYLQPPREIGMNYRMSPYPRSPRDDGPESQNEIRLSFRKVMAAATAFAAFILAAALELD